MPSEFFAPASNVLGRLEPAHRVLSPDKAGNLFVLRVRGAAPNEPKEVILKWDGFPENSVEFVASAYAAVTARFPKLRLIRSQGGGNELGRVGRLMAASR